MSCEMNRRFLWMDADISTLFSVSGSSDSPIIHARKLYKMLGTVLSASCEFSVSADGGHYIEGFIAIIVFFRFIAAMNKLDS